MSLIFVSPNQSIEDQVKQHHENLEKLQQLLGSPGWEVYDASLKAEEDRVYQVLQLAQTGDIAMKAAGTYTAIKLARELPMKYVTDTRDWLSKLPKK